MSDFKVAMLASGSKGNAALISNDKQNFLVDIGISCRMLNTKLKTLGLEIKDLDGVFLTHEHSDHVKGLETFCKNYQVPVYSSEKTWHAVLMRNRNIDRRNCRVIKGSMLCGDVKINSFNISHDAADPHGYSFTSQKGKCTYVTDTGFVTEAIKNEAQNADMLVLEANHDITMLKNGIYPELLKKRILSTRGHLSNDSAGWFLASLEQLPEQIILAHLSQENNLPSVALQTVENILQEKNKLQNTRILLASQENIVKTF